MCAWGVKSLAFAQKKRITVSLSAWLVERLRQPDIANISNYISKCVLVKTGWKKANLSAPIPDWDYGEYELEGDKKHINIYVYDWILDKLGRVVDVRSHFIEKCIIDTNKKWLKE